MKHFCDFKTGKRLIIEKELRKGLNIIEGVLRFKSNKYFIKMAYQVFLENQGYFKNFGFQRTK